MFEDALVVSTGRIRTHSRWFSGIAALFNGSVVSILLLWPLLHPASLPRQTLSTLLVAPVPPAAPAARVPQAAPLLRRSVIVANPFRAPTVIPKGIPQGKNIPAADTNAVLGAFAESEGTGLARGVLSSIGTVPPPAVQVVRPRRLAISSGVMAGNKLSGAVPQYPAIARAARQQGTVVLAATISKSGSIENLRILEGPAMLTQAAADAVRTWRYRPYMLNGEPVEVGTTVRVVFSLGG